MSVVNGSPVDETNTNNAFMSRLATSTSTVSIVSLLNTNTASGPAITNLQASVNSSERNIQTIANLLGGASLSINDKQGSHIFFLSGSGGAVSLSLTPFGSSFAGLDGTVVTLIGLDNTNTVTLNFNDASSGAIINGNITLFRGDSITLIWSETLDRWCEQCRNI